MIACGPFGGERADNPYPLFVSRKGACSMNTDGVDKQRIFVNGQQYTVDAEFASNYVEECVEAISDISKQIEQKSKQISDTVYELICNPSFESVANQMLSILNKAQRELSELLRQKQSDLDATMDATVPWVE